MKTYRKPVCDLVGQLSCKHKTFVKHLYNVGPTSKTLGRRRANFIQMFRICWEVTYTVMHNRHSPDATLSADISNLYVKNNILLGLPQSTRIRFSVYIYYIVSFSGLICLIINCCILICLPFFCSWSNNFIWSPDGMQVLEQIKLPCKPS